MYLLKSMSSIRKILKQPQKTIGQNFRKILRFSMTDIFCDFWPPLKTKSSGFFGQFRLTRVSQAGPVLEDFYTTGMSGGQWETRRKAKMNLEL